MDDKPDDIRARIDALKRQVALLNGGELTAGVAPDLPAEMEEQFWKRVLAFENAPLVEPFELLQRAGLELPPPDAVDDERLSQELHKTIEAMADHGLYLYSTDHLSDRELYTRLWASVLRDAVEWDEDDADAMWIINLVGSGTDEGTFAHLKYYADEKERQEWAEEWPDFVMPAHEDPPFDRDRHLPRP